MSGRKFPVTNNPEVLSVDELVEMFAGLMDEVENDLVDAHIMPFAARPELPQGLEAVVSWNEIHVESEDGITTRWVDPQGPADVTELTDVALNKYHMFLTQWRNYCRSEAARAKDRVDEAKKLVSQLASSIRIYLKESEGLPVNQVEDRLKLDPRWAKADLELLKLVIKHRRCENRQESYGSLIFSISREQTRRTGELKEETASHSSTKWRRPLR
jgi:hypothetical protein